VVPHLQPNPGMSVTLVRLTMAADFGLTGSSSALTFDLRVDIMLYAAVCRASSPTARLRIRVSWKAS